LEKLRYLADDRALLGAMKARSLELSAQFDIDAIARKFEDFLGEVSRGR
jgi:hypothetical protein